MIHLRKQRYDGQHRTVGEVVERAEITVAEAIKRLIHDFLCNKSEVVKSDAGFVVVQSKHKDGTWAPDAYSFVGGKDSQKEMVMLHEAITYFWCVRSEWPHIKFEHSLGRANYTILSESSRGERFPLKKALFIVLTEDLERSVWLSMINPLEVHIAGLHVMDIEQLMIIGCSRLLGTLSDEDLTHYCDAALRPPVIRYL
jgi:hypothetical protein